MSQINVEKSSKPELYFIGIQVRTINNDEMDPATAKLGPAWQRFHTEGLINKIPNRVSDCLYGIYSDYASDENGAYTVTIGSEVDPEAKAPQGMTKIKLPASRYMKFTSPKGAAPGIIVQTWQYIWQYFKDHAAPKRTYQGDFEVYDQRVAEPENAQIDIYIAI